MTKCSVFLTNCCKRPIGCKYSSDKQNMHSLYILKDRQLQNCPRNQYFIIQIKYYDRTLYFTIPIFITLQSLLPFSPKSHYCSHVLAPSYKKVNSVRGLISHTAQLEIHSSVSNQDKYVISRTCHTLYFSL